MIIVSQGHERGIGLEGFFRSLLCLPAMTYSQFELIISHKAYEFHKHYFKNPALKNLNLNLFNNFSPYSDTMQALEISLNKISPKDILITLPSSKDQFIDKHYQYSGHTDFFRSFYRDGNISMLFVGSRFHALLLTEHISISSVHEALLSMQINEKLKLAINALPELSKLIILGIDPHCGDKGVISHVDDLWPKLIFNLEASFPHLEIIGPISADSLIQNPNLDAKTLVVSAYHDQGLSLFKSIHGHLGINRTVGLPFVRLSPDHGTAFDLFQSGKMSIIGTLQTMNYALQLS
ncbi:MAG: 4-hydroxythreonine-4-phosphate dehydrogenase PdxA [Bacteriovoracaceae bacterium]|nr:4-hydroxythreonine-4-phosphate dehydrogenase PdxA [Bacteriovoracaceae bacterium]